MNTIKNILICDDVPENALLLEAILEADDYNIIIANSGREVLIFLEKSSKLVDLLIIDVRMPMMSGLEVVIHIRGSNKFKSLPILLLTGLNIDFDEESYSKLKINGFIKKNVNNNLIIAKVREILNLK